MQLCYVVLGFLPPLHFHLLIFPFKKEKWHSVQQQCGLVAEHLVLYLMLLAGCVSRTTCALLVLPFELSPGAAKRLDGLSDSQQQLHAREFSPLGYRRPLGSNTLPVPAMKPGVTCSQPGP